MDIFTPSRAPGRTGDALCLSRERLKALKWSRPLVLMPVYVSVRRELASVDQLVDRPCRLVMTRSTASTPK
jgi:hypothetical protein